MLLTDIQASRKCPTSRFLTKEEIHDIRPYNQKHRINFIFKELEDVDNDLALKLLEKYKSIQRVDEDGNPIDNNDELQNMKHFKLLELAKKEGVKIEFGIKKQDLLVKIRKHRQCQNT